MPEAVVVMSGVSKVFRTHSGEDVEALRKVDLRVDDGEFVVVLGPTGCGKTSLLNLIGGLEVCDEGDVQLADTTRKVGTGYVFQHYTLFPWRTVLRNVAFGLEMGKMARSLRMNVASDFIARVGLAGFEQAYPHELSGGMRQRAAIAQALARRPGLLLLDEPFGALDDCTRAGLQAMLLDLWRKSRVTILFVTHNVEEAAVLADRVLTMSNSPGRVVGETRIDMPRPRRMATREFAEILVNIREAMGTET